MVKRPFYMVDESVCMACGTCVEACPFGAFRIDGDLFMDELAEFDRRFCRGCDECEVEDACPTGAISVPGE